MSTHDAPARHGQDARVVPGRGRRAVAAAGPIGMSAPVAQAGGRAVLAPSALLAMQATTGNRSVQRLLEDVERGTAGRGLPAVETFLRPLTARHDPAGGARAATGAVAAAPGGPTIQRYIRMQVADFKKPLNVGQELRGVFAAATSQVGLSLGDTDYLEITRLLGKYHDLFKD